MLVCEIHIVLGMLGMLGMLAMVLSGPAAGIH